MRRRATAVIVFAVITCVGGCTSSLEKCKKQCHDENNACEFEAKQRVGDCVYGQTRSLACQQVTQCRQSSRQCYDTCRRQDAQGIKYTLHVDPGTVTATGKVVDAITNEPVPGVLFSLEDASGQGDQKATSDSKGIITWKGLNRRHYYGAFLKSKRYHLVQGDYFGKSIDYTGPATYDMGERQLCRNMIPPGVQLLRDGKFKDVTPVSFTNFDLAKASNQVGYVNPYTSLHFFYLTPEQVRAHTPVALRKGDILVLTGFGVPRRFQQPNVKFAQMKLFDSKTYKILGGWTPTLPHAWYAGVKRVGLIDGRFSYSNYVATEQLKIYRPALTRCPGVFRITTAGLSPGIYVISAENDFLANPTSTYVSPTGPEIGYMFVVGKLPAIASKGGK